MSRKSKAQEHFLPYFFRRWLDFASALLPNKEKKCLNITKSDYISVKTPSALLCMFYFAFWSHCVTVPVILLVFTSTEPNQSNLHGIWTQTSVTLFVAEHPYQQNTNQGRTMKGDMEGVGPLSHVGGGGRGSLTDWRRSVPLGMPNMPSLNCLSGCPYGPWCPPLGPPVMLASVSICQCPPAA